MKVVILCGGMGTRLREETEFKPKPMVQIGDKPILWHIMKIYMHYGFNEFILCLGYKGEVIKQFFYHYDLMNSDFTIEYDAEGKRILTRHSPPKERWKVTLVDTGIDTLKASRIKMVSKYIDGENFFATYGDGVADINLRELLEFHLSHGKIATVTGVSVASRFGELEIEGNRVVCFKEKVKNSSSFINGGFFVFNRKIFDYIPDTPYCELETDVLERLAHDGELMVYKHRGFWACMDTYRDYEYLNKLWKEKKAFWKVWKD